MPRFRSVSLCRATILCAISPMALMPFSKLPPEWAALPVTSMARNTPPLREVTTLPLGRPGSELNTQRAWRPAEALEGRQHEGVEHQPALHVDHARPIGAAALDAERPARHLALGE